MGIDSNGLLIPCQCNRLLFKIQEAYNWDRLLLEAYNWDRLLLEALPTNLRSTWDWLEVVHSCYQRCGGVAEWYSSRRSLLSQIDTNNKQGPTIPVLVLLLFIWILAGWQALWHHRYGCWWPLGLWTGFSLGRRGWLSGRWRGFSYRRRGRLPGRWCGWLLLEWEWFGQLSEIKKNRGNMSKQLWFQLFDSCNIEKIKANSRHLSMMDYLWWTIYDGLSMMDYLWWTIYDGLVMHHRPCVQMEIMVVCIISAQR